MDKIVCIMAAHGRSAITTETVRMLQKQTLPIEVLMVGDSVCEKEIADKTGCIYLEHQNKPLGKKWQAGVDYARTLTPDAVMICGSDSWLSPRWVEVATPHLYGHNDLVGINTFYACKIYPNKKVQIIRRAYKDDRVGKPMGSGRIFSKSILEQLNWCIFPVRKNVGMDSFSVRKIKKHEGIIKIVNLDDMKILAIKSTWDSISSWDSYLKAKNLKIFPDIKHPKVWLNQHFPGSVNALQRVVKNIKW